MTKQTVIVVLAMLIVPPAAHPASGDAADGWIPLFDGRTLDGWKAGDNSSTFTVHDGAIVANGPRSHLFYVGPVKDAEFADFELKVDVMTRPGSNGGIYFHTRYQQADWPRRGFEVQVNNSYDPDPIKTGSLYGIANITTAPANDNAWFTQHITVIGRYVTIRIDGRKVAEWAEPQSSTRRRRKRLSAGTFALQGHDPGSTVLYKNIRVRPLRPLDFPIVDYHVHLKGGLTLDDAVTLSEKLGIKFGIAVNCGLGFPVTGDQEARKFFESLEGRPVLRAMQAEGREWLTMFSKDVIAQFDYVFTDAMTFTDNQGRRTRLWINNEVHIDDPQDFMDMYVEKILAILETEPIDIYVNATFLPEVIRPDYDKLWTPRRMDRVIQAARKNNIAIEINTRYRIPSIPFIRRAKEAGVKFSFGTNNAQKNDLGIPDYCLTAASICGLTKKDMFTPGFEG
jgi:hypothetical protein